MSLPGKIAIIIGLVLTGGVIAATAYSLIQSNPTVPRFSYNPSSIEGWWNSDNTNLQKMAKSLGSRYTDKEPIAALPIADLTVHHGEKDAEAPKDNCFVAFSYYDTPLVDLSTAYEKYESRKKDEGTLEVRKATQQAMQTFEGEKEFDLRRYSYTIEDKDVLSGYEVGFFALKSGYVRIEGVCKTADDLDLTLPILTGVTLNER